MLNAHKTHTHNTHWLGHRGARGEIRENSWQGFIYTKKIRQLAQGKLAGIEFDVQLTKDNQLVVFHDDTLIRLYQNQTRVDQSSYRELTRLSAGRYPLFLLEELLYQRADLLEGYSHIELEVKTHERTHYYELVTALADTLNHPQFKEYPIVLTSFDVHLLHHLQTHPFLSSLNRGLLVEPKTLYTNHIQQNKFNLSLTERLYKTPYTAMRLGCSGIGLYYALFDSNIIALCRRFNLNTSAWTVNSPTEAMRLMSLGVDYIITDYPSLMLSLNPS